MSTRAEGFYEKFCMCDGSLFTAWMCCGTGLAFLSDVLTEWKRFVEVIEFTDAFIRVNSFAKANC